MIYKKRSEKINILQTEDAQLWSNYEKLNKAFTKKNNYKEENVILYDTSDSNYSSSSEAENSPDED